MNAIQTIAILAPCKINLSLKVTGLRKDGYHLISSVMQVVSLYNRVELSVGEKKGIELLCSDPDIPTDERNTAWRAAAAFYEALKLEKCVRIRITKGAPCQAGLGSASADAAGVLIGLNKMYEEPLSMAELCTLGLTIGADVPFCLRGGAALTEGIGEFLTPLPPLRDCAILLVKPVVGYATPEMFRRFDRLPPMPAAMQGAPVSYETIADVIRSGSLSEIGRLVENDLERAAPDDSVAMLKSKIYAGGAVAAAMTGSGSAVFGLFETVERAKSCLEGLTPFVNWGAAVVPVDQGPICLYSQLT